MGIEYIEVKNFQAHESERIEFDPTLTTIIGITDAGKSSLLRAVRWVALNVPNGDSFIRYGSNGAECTLGIDGHRITRRRMSNGENKYILDGDEFVSFGSSVPDRIQKLLQVDRINFVGQKEPDFWFTLSPSEVARQINTIVDLSIIDETNTNIGLVVHRAQDAVRNTTQRLAVSREKKSALEWVVDAEIDLTAVEDAHHKADALCASRSDLMFDIRELENHTKRRDQFREQFADTNIVGRQAAVCLKLAEQTKSIAVIIEDAARLQDIQQFIKIDTTELDDALVIYQRYKKAISFLSPLVESITGLQRTIDLRPDGFDELTSALMFVKNRNDVAQNLSCVIADIEKARDLYLWRSGEYCTAHEIFEEICVGQCPVCGTEMQ